MPARSIIEATTKNCIEYQRAAESSAAEARMWNEGRDKFAPRVIHNQQTAAMYHREMYMRLAQLIGV